MTNMHRVVQPVDTKKDKEKAMFCIYCGNAMDPSDPVCPKCNRMNHLEGGNGFWDMAGEPRREKQPVEPPRERVVIREVEKVSPIPVVISAALCLVCIIVLIVSQAANGRAIKKLSADCKAQISRLEGQYIEQLEQMETRITALEEQQTEENEPQDDSIHVISSPTDEEQAEGFESREGRYLFKFQIEEAAVSFLWEKQSEDGEWLPLEFDKRDVDSRYGLKLEENKEQGTSKLIAVGLTAESEGTYRCTVETEDGTETVTVNLIIRADKAAIQTPIPKPFEGSEDEPDPDEEE